MSRFLTFGGMLGAAFLLLAPRPSPAVEPVYYHDVDLLLSGALTTGKNPQDLLLHLGYKDGQWHKFAEGWAHQYWTAPGQPSPRDRFYNSIDHEGVVERASTANGRSQLKIAMTIHADPWVAGGAARYELDLTQDGDKFTGTFTGTFQGQPVQGNVTGSRHAQPWPAPVAGVKPFAPGEHPRLIFRKSDLPALRARMNTPEGQAILARLRLLLDGPYTLHHAMGYGFLHQLTGDPKYAELARQCVDKAVVDKAPDRDARYSWHQPGGKLRAGPSYAAIAMAYDLCYDAWPEHYRRSLARQIQDKIIRAQKPATTEMAPTQTDDGEPGEAEPTNGDLVFHTLGGQLSPQSNHYGAWNGGGGTALLAILNDPGTDPELCHLAHRIFQRRAKRALTEGHGSGGFFFEGHHCGRLSANTGLTKYLQALRVAEGKDFVSPSPAASWLLTKWIYEVVRHDGALINLQRGMYAARTFERHGLSAGGDFAQGFGICPEAHKPAVLWFYNHVINPGPAKDYDALVWPHRAVYAFVNWPIGLAEKNPAELLPKYLRDAKAGYYIFRSGWRPDGQDVVATMYVNSMMASILPKGVRIPGAIFGQGVEGEFDVLRRHDRSYQPLENGAACVLRQGTETFLADLSGLSGAPLVLVKIKGLPDMDGPPQLTADDPLAILAGRFESKREQVAPPSRSELAIAELEVPADKLHVAKRSYYLSGCQFEVTSFQAGNPPRGQIIGPANAQKLVLGQRTLAVVNDQLVVGQTPAPSR